MTVFSKPELDHLDHEYSPSRHTKRYKTADEAIQGHIKLIEEGKVIIKELFIFKNLLSVTYFCHDTENVKQLKVKLRVFLMLFNTEIKFIELLFDDVETYKVRNECGFAIDFDVKYGTEDDEVLDVYSKRSTVKSKKCFLFSKQSCRMFVQTIE